MSPPPSDAFQTQTVIRDLLSEAGVRPRHRFGQHFLIDRNLMMKLVDAADLTTEDCVLEIGAGTGSLTGLLLARAGHVVTVEIDRVLAGLLQRRLSGSPHVTLLHMDVLAKKSVLAEPVREALRVHGTTRGRRLKLVANLPYDIATAVVMNLLLEELSFERFCFTVQAEVAARFLSPPGVADYGPVSILAQSMARLRRIAVVPARAFWPPPKVRSALLRVDPLPRDAWPVREPRRFAEFVRNFFLHRRQTLSRVIRRMPRADAMLAALTALGIDPMHRPQNLTVAQWTAFYARMD